MNHSDLPPIGPIRTPPHSIEAEATLLGGLMLSGAKLWDSIGDMVVADDFYRTEHRHVFEAITSLVLACKPVDVITVFEQIQRSPEAKKFDITIGFVNALAQFEPNATTARRYAQIVREKALRRRLASAGMEIDLLAFDDSLDFEQMAERANALLAAINGDVARGDDWADLSGDLVAFLDRAQAAADGKAEPGDFIATGLTDLDELLNGGMRQGQLVVVGARPSMGKTALALTVALNVCRAGHGVGMFSMEMTRREVMERLLSSISRLHLTRIQRPERLQEHDWGALSAGTDALRALRFEVSDAGGLNINQIKARARSLKRRMDVRVLIVDYLGLMIGTNPKEPRAYQLEEATNKLKALAKELKLAVILLAQVNRESEKRTDQMPVLSDLRDSGAIEQDADVVVFIHRPIKAKPDLGRDWEYLAKLSVAKNRNGPLGVRDVMYIGENTRFKDWPDEIPKPAAPGRGASKGGDL